MVGSEQLPLRVEMDEASLAASGWELAKCRADVVDLQVDEETWVHRIFGLGRIRRYPYINRLLNFKHGFGEYVFGTTPRRAPVLWQLRSQTHGALTSFQNATLFERMSIRLPEPSWVSATPADPDDLYVWLGAADWEEIDRGCASPSFNWADVPIELADHTTHSAIRAVVLDLTARIRDNANLEVTLSIVHPLGTAWELLSIAESAGPSVFDERPRLLAHAPDVRIEILDETGSLLDSRELINDRWVGLEADGRGPARDPSLLVATSQPLDELADAPALVAVTLTDPAPGRGFQIERVGTIDDPG